MGRTLTCYCRLDTESHGRHRRYPVLFLFHGALSDEDSWSTQTDVLAFTAGLDDDDQVIAVMPDGEHLPVGRDWVDGSHPEETFFLDSLLPYIDANYRTIPDGSHRAAAGFSSGGLEAMVYAARHPDLLVAAASFSGFLDPYAGFQSIVPLFVGLDDELCGGTEEDSERDLGRSFGPSHGRDWARSSVLADEPTTHDAIFLGRQWHRWRIGSEPGSNTGVFRIARVAVLARV